MRGARTRFLRPAAARRLGASLALAAAIACPAAAQAAEGWLIAGPFAAGSQGLADPLDLDFLASSGLAAEGEAAARPSLVQAVGKESWKESAAATSQDGAGVDFIAAFGQVEDAVAYAYRSFRSASAVDAVMRLGSDDGAKVWINGKLVFGNHAHRALSDGQDAVLVRLEKGENRVLVKVGQGWGSWGFLLRFADPAVERKAALVASPGALALCLDEDSGRPGGTISGSVMTASPAALVEGGAVITLRDAGGAPLASARAPISGRFSLRVPEGATELCYLGAVGTGRAAGLSAPAMALVVGDPSFLLRSALATARVASASLARSASPSPRSCPDPAATLEFLAAELEGRIPAALQTREALMLALGDIKSAAYGTEPLPGLHRYAYRSKVDGAVQPYSLYVPPGYDPSRRYGLVLALHGASGNDYDMAASIASANPPDMLVLAPFGRGDLGWSATGETDAMDVLDLALGGYSVDPERVYLTGRSMGGFGTWRLGQLYARRFAAIAPFAGWTGTDCLENLVNTPVLVVHGEADDTIPIDEDRAAVAILKELGCEVRFDSLPGAGHDAMGAWFEAGGPERLLDWFRPRRLAAWPDKVMARTSQARYGRQAWVGILGLSRPLAEAGIDAAVVDERHISIETENVAAFSLDLRHPKLASSGRLLLLVDGKNLTADAGSAEAVFELGQDGRFKAAAPRRAAAGIPPNGGSGFAGLFEGPVAFVYGTGVASRAGVNRRAALALAGRDENGPLPGGIILGTFPVLRDTEVDALYAASHSLVLVGGVEENSALARLAGRLPVAIGRGSVEVAGRSFKKAGTIMVCPNPEAPGRLLCVFALPFDEARVAAYGGGLSAALGAFGSNRGACGFGTPDLTILDSAMKVAWMGSFDRSWEDLVDLSPAAKK
jgi:hypothetical protein